MIDETAKAAGWFPDEPTPREVVLSGVDDVGPDDDAVDWSGWEASLVDPDPEASERNIRRILAEAEAERVARMMPEAVLGRIAGIRHQVGELLAQELRELAVFWQNTRQELPVTVSGSELDLAHRSVVAELAVVCRVSERTMAARLDNALTLVERFPATLSAVEQGRITMAHAGVITDYGQVITDAPARAAYEAAVLERAVTVTPGRLRRVAQLAATRLGETSFQERHEEANTRRSVVVRESDHGMSELVHTVPTILAEAIWDRLTAQAKAITQAGDTRSFDQIRADLVTELLLTGDPSGYPEAPHAAGRGIRAEVSLVIPMLSLLGENNGTGPEARDGVEAGIGAVEPATLLGKGPIDLATATRLAAGAPSITRILTHPVSGMVLSVDRYRPSEQLRSYLKHRDGRCRFPSCNRNPARCDIDHTIDAQHGGPTSAGNLACLCRRHHTLKHQTPWRVRQPVPGILEWESPHGQVTTDLPDTPVRFTRA